MEITRSSSASMIQERNSEDYDVDNMDNIMGRGGRGTVASMIVAAVLVGTGLVVLTIAGGKVGFEGEKY